MKIRNNRDLMQNNDTENTTSLAEVMMMTSTQEKKKHFNVNWIHFELFN